MIQPVTVVVQRASRMAVYEVKDKVFMVTGGAMGLGALTVEAFLEQGAKYVAFLDVAKDAGDTLEVELREKYGADRVKFIKCDVTNDEELFNAYDMVIRDKGYIDVVVNNAGIFNDSKNMYKKSIAVNVTALITSTLKAIEIMRKDKGGRGGTVINISSQRALMQGPVAPIYSSTKSAIMQFSNCIGMEPHCSRTGVRVITVCYGSTESTMLTQNKLGGFDEATDALLDPEVVRSNNYIQRAETAVAGLVELYKVASGGSTWYIGKDKPPVDITSSVKEAYSILTKAIS